jgi:hypothetical protein
MRSQKKMLDNELAITSHTWKISQKVNDELNEANRRMKEENIRLREHRKVMHDKYHRLLKQEEEFDPTLQPCDFFTSSSGINYRDARPIVRENSFGMTVYSNTQHQRTSPFIPNADKQANNMRRGNGLTICNNW